MLNAGDTLGDWVVVHHLGEGGMGSVLRCHSQLSEDVEAAVKVVKAHGLGEMQQRFIEEMRTLASLSHPSIVSVLSGGRDAERGVVYMAMELIDGGDLDQRLRHGPLSRDEVCGIFVPITQALACAHSHGVHHRDLKPANIMLRSDGPPVLVDFGIAVAKDRTRLTTNGTVPGTAAYMPPEVFRGEDPDLCKGDIYALGVVLWEALTGEHAFHLEGEMSEGQRLFSVVGQKVASEALDPGPAHEDALRELVRSMTAPNPEERLADLSEVLRVLGRVPQMTQWVPMFSARPDGDQAPYAPTMPVPVADPTPAPAPPPAASPGTEPEVQQPVALRPVARRLGRGLAIASLLGMGAVAAAVVSLGAGFAAVGAAEALDGEAASVPVVVEAPLAQEEAADVPDEIGRVVVRVERALPRARPRRRARPVQSDAVAAVPEPEASFVSVLQVAAEPSDATLVQTDAEPQTPSEPLVEAAADPPVEAHAEPETEPEAEPLIEVVHEPETRPEPETRRRGRARDRSGSGYGGYSY